MSTTNRTLEFQFYDEATGFSATIVLTEQDDGTILFEIFVDSTETIGDLRGIFFDISDETLLSGLIAEGDLVGTQTFKNDNEGLSRLLR